MRQNVITSGDALTPLPRVGFVFRGCGGLVRTGGEAMAAAAAEMMIPLKRIGTPEEAAGAMLLLASPYASFITGQVGFLHRTNRAAVFRALLF